MADEEHDNAEQGNEEEGGAGGEEVVEKPGPPPGAPHVLQHKWSLWFDNPKLKKDNESWEENLKKVHTFGTVEEFWCLFNNVIAPTKLALGSNFHVFKDGIQPMWEDATNKDGGKWVLSIPKQRRKNVDMWWMYSILMMIGENLNDECDVCGAVVSLRKNQDRIALWTKSARKESLQIGIGTQLRSGLELPKSMALKFQSHADAYASGSSFQNKVHYEV
jgi:translation initiation factor 4E